MVIATEDSSAVVDEPRAQCEPEDWGKACSGCGYCCKRAPCLYGVFLNGPKGPCELLRKHDGRYWCGVLLAARGELRKQVERSLRIGEGCIGPWMRETLEGENAD